MTFPISKSDGEVSEEIVVGTPGYPFSEEIQNETERPYKAALFLQNSFSPESDVRNTEPARSVLSFTCETEEEFELVVPLLRKHVRQFNVQMQTTNSNDFIQNIQQTVDRATRPGTDENTGLKGFVSNMISKMPKQKSNSKVPTMDELQNIQPEDLQGEATTYINSVYLVLKREYPAYPTPSVTLELLETVDAPGPDNLSQSVFLMSLMTATAQVAKQLMDDLKFAAEMSDTPMDIKRKEEDHPETVPEALVSMIIPEEIKDVSSVKIGNQGKSQLDVG